MYVDLKSKLQMYKSNSQPKAPVIKDEGLDIHNLLKGSVLNRPEGACFMLEKEYPLTHLHGGLNLGQALETDERTLGLLAGQNAGALKLTDFLFLDTETTGLSGGAGTVAFLVGTGFFRDGCFILRQYFMRDYHEEAAMLHFLNELLAGFKGLVTFNGKAFDWHLLTGRFIFQRIKPVLKDPVQIDLLTPSRRIWKLKLKSIKLSSLEESILGEHRVDDIPGGMIPETYFKYLESRDARTIVKVIGHNALDILSMVALITRLHSMLQDPVAESDCGLELLGLGRIFEAGGEHSNMENCLEVCSKSASYYVKGTAVKRLSGMYKRSRDYDKAVKYWEDMLKGPVPGLYPMIELAKYYEHRKKDIPKAVEMVKKAIETNLRVGRIDYIHEMELKKRLNRLMGKLERSKNNGCTEK